jgi:hypothetical protein
MNRAALVLLSAFGLVGLSSSFSVAVGHSVDAPDEVLKWNAIAIDAVRHNSTPPPLVARNMAILHGAMYDAVNATFRTHTVYRVSIKPPPLSSPSAAAAAAAHRVLRDLYPGQVKTFDAALRHSLIQVPDRRAQEAGVQLGSFVAARFLVWRRPDEVVAGDGTYRSDDGLWLPTPPQFQKALLPQWGRVTPFAVQNPKEFRSGSPPGLSTPEYARCFDETKALGAIASTVRTEDQTEIAHFWEDGPKTCTPPGHWNEIARTVALGRGNTLEENARLFALLNISMADAAICCWDCKFMYKYWRPVTGIRNAGDDDNPDTVPDPNWTPLLETPPFPAYTSGHSSFSGAAAAVLTAFFGTDHIQFTATSDALPGVQRTYASFSEAANDAGLSRIYGGIHWACDNVEGLAMGQAVGAYVSRNFMRHSSTAQTSAGRTDNIRDFLTSFAKGILPR